MVAPVPFDSKSAARARLRTAADHYEQALQHLRAAGVQLRGIAGIEPYIHALYRVRSELDSQRCLLLDARTLSWADLDDAARKEAKDRHDGTQDALSDGKAVR